MKTLFLTLSIIVSTVLNKPQAENSKFIGTWKSEASDYTMLITAKNKNLNIYNYNFERQNLDNVSNVTLNTVEEKVVKFSRRKMKTNIFYEINNHKVSITYKIINNEKMKAIFKGNWNGVIYYNKQNK
jgi:hypothetical protein